MPGVEGKAGITTDEELSSRTSVSVSHSGANVEGRLVPGTGPVTGGVVPAGTENAVGFFYRMFVVVNWVIDGRIRVVGGGIVLRAERGLSKGVKF